MIIKWAPNAASFCMSQIHFVVEAFLYPDYGTFITNNYFNWIHYKSTTRKTIKWLCNLVVIYTHKHVLLLHCLFFHFFGALQLEENGKFSSSLAVQPFFSSLIIPFWGIFQGKLWWSLSLSLTLYTFSYHWTGVGAGVSSGCLCKLVDSSEIYIGFPCPNIDLWDPLPISNGPSNQYWQQNWVQPASEVAAEAASLAFFHCESLHFV